MAYWRLHFHLVWATYQRLPLITQPIERQIYGTLLGKAKELGIIVHAIGGIQDHVHLAVSIPPKLAVADCLKHFKGASSRYVNQHPESDGSFKWREGYGAVTFGDRAMADVVAYVRDQKEHHRQGSTRLSFERIAEEEQGVEISDV